MKKYNRDSKAFMTLGLWKDSVHAILESVVVSFNIHFSLNWEMVTALAMLKIKLHMLPIIWDSGHMLIVRPLLLTTFAFPYKMDFLAGTIRYAVVG